MNHVNPEIRRYLHAVAREMICPRKQKQETLHRLSADLEDFTETSDHAPSRVEIEAHFGTPAEIAANFQNQVGSSVAQRGFFRGWRRALLATAVLVITVLLGLLWKVQDVAPIPDIDIQQTESFSGQKNVTFFSRDNKRLLTLSLSGEFSGGGRTANPDSAALATVIHDPDVQINTQCAYTSGDTVYGFTCVTYNGETTSQTVRLTCDHNGKIC